MLEEHEKSLLLAVARGIDNGLWELRQPVRRKQVIVARGVATGVTLEVTSEPVPPGMCWLVERIVYTTNAAGGQAAMFLESSATDDALLDLPAAGVRVVSAPPAPIYVPPGSKLAFLWTGIVAGNEVRARLQYRQEPIYISRDGTPFANSYNGGLQPLEAM